MRRRGAALAALTLACATAGAAAAQDSTPPAPAIPAHVIAIDTARVLPFQRAFDMLVRRGDSTFVIGERTLSLLPAAYGGAPAWLLVETRTGVVPAVESLYVSRDLRPLHWTATLGAARLAVEFRGDSIYGATATPAGRRSIVLGARPDMIASTGMIEALLPAVTLTADWKDSVAVLAVDQASASLLPGQLAVIGEEGVLTDLATPRLNWVVALRVGNHNVLFWVDEEMGEVRRVYQPLPAHDGTSLEYRLRETSYFPEPGQAVP